MGRQTVVKPLRWVKKDNYAIVYVQADDGAVYEVYVGGVIQTYFHHQKLKAYVIPPWLLKSVDSEPVDLLE